MACKRSRERGGRTMPCCISITSVFESPWGWTHGVDTVHHARTTCQLITLSCPFMLFLFPSSFHVSLFPILFNSLTPPCPSPFAGNVANSYKVSSLEPNPATKRKSANFLLFGIVFHTVYFIKCQAILMLDM